MSDGPIHEHDAPGSEHDAPGCIVCHRTSDELVEDADVQSEWKTRLFPSKCGCTVHICGNDFLNMVKSNRSCMYHTKCPVCSRDMGIMVKRQIPDTARDFIRGETAKASLAAVAAWAAGMAMDQMPLYIFFFVLEVKFTIERHEAGAPLQAQFYLALMPAFALYSVVVFSLYWWTEAWPFHCHVLTYYLFLKLVMLVNYSKVRMHALELQFATVQYRPPHLVTPCAH